ncbi:unnamed protein product [Linum tenue]|uniref:Uncharacterized protein n=1 Tax=Linum tenue TaxID=586396 RepID=A0AAV0S3T9_9ROSI|nr:unnamed protein product [Linum tenue]
MERQLNGKKERKKIEKGNLEWSTPDVAPTPPEHKTHETAS